jgi:ABC-2 type transport system ATP-binding protein
MSGRPDQPSIRADQLTKRFGDFTAVDAVSFAVARGEVFGFLGPNGAGKTTTIKMLAGLLVPTSGSGAVAGFDLAGRTQEVKHHIGYMSQIFSLYPDLSVEENITFFSGLYGVARYRAGERRDWVLDMAGLRDQRRRLVRELPLGWKQRLSLGCAVLHEPPVLFLDEPTSGVDPVSRRNFWELIYTLAARGTTVLVSTHYMEEAEYCHRLALMNRGRLVALDTPRGLRAGMRRPVVEIRTDNGPRAAAALEGREGVLEAGMFGRHAHAIVVDAADALRMVPEVLGRAGVKLEGMTVIEPSLEDVFIALVKEQGGAPVD